MELNDGAYDEGAYDRRGVGRILLGGMCELALLEDWACFVAKLLRPPLGGLLRSDALLGDGPSGMAGRLSAMFAASVTLEGRFLFCNFTVGVRLDLMRCLRLEVLELMLLLSPPVTVSAKDTHLGAGASSCFRSLSRCSGVEVDASCELLPAPSTSCRLGKADVGGRYNWGEGKGS